MCVYVCMLMFDMMHSDFFYCVHIMFMLIYMQVCLCMSVCEYASICAFTFLHTCMCTAPHSDIVPVIRETEDALLNKSLTRSSKDYIDILKRKYHVP